MHGTRIHYDGPPDVLVNRKSKLSLEERARNFEKRISRVTAISRNCARTTSNIVENGTHVCKTRLSFVDIDDTKLNKVSFNVSMLNILMRLKGRIGEG